MTCNTHNILPALAKSLRRVVVCALFMVPFALSQPGVVGATSESNVDDGNCNNWHAHGWSQTIWSGYGSSAWGSVNPGRLSWFDGSKWVTVYSYPSVVYGGSGTAQVDNYHPNNDYGTGTWEENGSHYGSMINGSVYQWKNFWCG